MKGKRSKQYRKLMHQYHLHFGFREPYQVLVDAAILQDAARFKMDFAGGLSKALHGKVKLMITHCCIRHLYESEPKDSTVVSHAKAFEKRHCNHHELEKPLSTIECINSVLDPKGTKNNKHKYVVASQDENLRAYLRTVPGVPLVYLKRSVMIMEPMPRATADVLEREERAKFRSGLKRKRNSSPNAGKANPSQRQENSLDDATGTIAHPELEGSKSDEGLNVSPEVARKQRRRLVSEPNPLSMKKPKNWGSPGPRRPTFSKANGDMENPRARQSA